MVKFDAAKSVAMRVGRALISSGVASAVVIYALSYLSTLEQTALIGLITSILMGLDKYLRIKASK